jgi:hypothetical protein
MFVSCHQTITPLRLLQAVSQNVQGISVFTCRIRQTGEDLDVSWKDGLGLFGRL